MFSQFAQDGNVQPRQTQNVMGLELSSAQTLHFCVGRFLRPDVGKSESFKISNSKTLIPEDDTKKHVPLTHESVMKHNSILKSPGYSKTVAAIPTSSVSGNNIIKSKASQSDESKKVDAISNFSEKFLSSVMGKAAARGIIRREFNTILKTTSFWPEIPEGTSPCAKYVSKSIGISVRSAEKDLTKTFLFSKNRILLD